MEGKKFSSSKRVVIYVRDMLSRYQPDAFRYFVAVAGPESQDSDFSWSGVRARTNDELVAGWGNLVNRTATLIAKNFGEIPPAGALTAEDQALLDRVDGAFATVGGLIGRNRMKAAIGEAMRAVATSTSTSPTPSRGSSRATTSASGSARCCTSWPSAWPTSTWCSRRSCRSAPTRSTAPSAARARSRRCRGSRRSRTSTAARRTPSSPATTAVPPPGSATPSGSGRRSPSPRRCSPSSTCPWSTRS